MPTLTRNQEKKDRPKTLQEQVAEQAKIIEDQATKINDQAKQIEVQAGNIQDLQSVMNDILINGI